MKIIIISEMRVGSRWLHYLLSELFGMKVSAELDFKDLPTCATTVRERFAERRIVKFHHVIREELYENIKPVDYKVIGIVRNPRDRMVSWTFHQRYKPPGRGLKIIKDAPSDLEAVKAVFNLELPWRHNERQFPLMVRGMSTKKYDPSVKQTYVWTCYHWLVNDTYKEVKTICKFLDSKVPDTSIRRLCIKHSFKNKSGREPGKEIRRDEWRRKGIENDWKNWLDEYMIEKTEDISNRYWKIIKEEEKSGT